MMIHAYREIYLNSAMNNLGDMFDFVISDLGLPSGDFISMFLSSDICRKLENGEPKYLVGMSGIEMAIDIIRDKTGIEPVYDYSNNEQTGMYSETPDFWCGWALCYYQWLRAVPYKQILRRVSYDELQSLYPTLHEADVSKFADVMDKACRAKSGETNLKRIRNARGLSQRGLAERSGVTLRSIQMYEQRNKDIRKGQSETLLRLAAILGCSIESLIN